VFANLLLLFELHCSDWTEPISNVFGLAMPIAVVVVPVSEAALAAHLPWSSFAILPLRVATKNSNRVCIPTNKRIGRGIWILRESCEDRDIDPGKFV